MAQQKKCSAGARCNFSACKKWHPNNRKETPCRYKNMCLKSRAGECPLSHPLSVNDDNCPYKSNCNQPICKARHPEDRKETVCKFEDKCKTNKEGKCPLAHPSKIIIDLIHNVKKLEGYQRMEHNQRNRTPFHNRPSRRSNTYNNRYWKGHYPGSYSHYHQHNRYT